MNQADLVRQISALRARTAALFQRAGESSLSEPELLIEAFEELRSTVEEMHVAEEELRAQNEDLERRVAERTEQLEALIHLKDELLTREQAARAAADEAAEQLRQIEQRFHVAITHSPVTVFHQDRELRYTWLHNPTAGFSVDESLGKLDADLLPAEDAARLTALKRRVLELGTGIRDEIALTSDGKTRHYDLTIEPQRDQSGATVGITGAAIDVTEWKRAEEALRFLDQAGSILATSLDYEVTLENLVRLVIPRLGDWSAIDVLHEDGSIRRVASAHVDPAKDELLHEIRRRYPVLPGGRHPVARALRAGNSILAPEISEPMLTSIAEDDEHLQLLRRLDTNSLIVVPLAGRGRMLGTIMLGSGVPSRYDSEDLIIAKLIGRRAAVAIDNARLYAAEQQARRAAERAVERTTRHQAVTAMLAAALSPTQVAAAVIEQGVAMLGARAGVLVLLSDDGQTLEPAASVGYAPEVLEPFSRFPIHLPVPLADAVRSGDIVLLESLEDRNARYPYLATTKTSNRAFAALPLRTEERTIGAIGLSFAEPRTFDEDDRAFMWSVAQQCALGLQRTRLYEAEKSARAKAEMAEANYRALFEGVADAIVVLDPEGRVINANPAAAMLLGYSQEELLQLHMTDVVAAESEWIEAEHAETLRTGSWKRELEFQRKDGSAVPVEARGRVVRMPPGTVIIAMLRDISERRAIERLQREFLSTVSHELKNPLTAVKGYAQLMRRSAEYSQRAVEAIVSQTDRLARLVDDLLDVAQLEAGRLELRRGTVDLAVLVMRVAEHAQTLSTIHTVRAEVPANPAIGRWDPDRIEQVLENLVSNAMKYSPDGGEVVLRVEHRGDRARVSVADQGVGIPPEDLRRVFDRFYRSAGVANSIPGLGLGLYITRSLVQAHGGWIWAEPAGDRGTKFSFVLPYDGERIPHSHGNG